jgi:hypothetical protein
VEIKNIKLGKRDNLNQLSYDVCHNGSVASVWFRTDAERITEDGDIFLSTCLLPAMAVGENLVINKPVSPLLLRNVNQLQEIYSSWHPKFKKIQIKAEGSRNTVVAPPTEVASFFSGGVDSFYSLIKNNAEITTLIYVQGFDVWSHETEFLEKVRPRMVESARQFGKKLITVRTNLHEFSDPFAEWGREYHGSALASVAHLLAPTIKKFFVPSTYSYPHLSPWGSHLLTDPLWSTNTIEIIHDGAEASRPGKMKEVCQNQCALETLRVCLDRTSGKYNCGTCEKCLRTMLNLHVYDRLQQCRTFSNELTFRRVAKICIKSDFVKMEYQELLQALKLNRPGSVHIAAIIMILIRYEITTLWRTAKIIFR